MSTSPNAYVLRMTDRLEDGLRDNVIGIGWAKARDLDREEDWERFKQHIADAYPSYRDNAHSLGNAAGSVYRFVHTMKSGDLVVIPSAGGMYVARVLDENAHYDATKIDADFAWRRKVEWLKRDIRRTFATNALQRRLKARQTCVDASELLRDIQDAIGRTKPISFASEVLESAQEAVAKQLITALNDRQLEDLVRVLVTAGGADAVVLPKRQGQPGDVDVKAVYDLKIARQDARVEVLFQIKQHEGSTDVDAVRQLKDRIAATEAARPTLAFVVTTAESFSNDARELAEESDIGLIAGRELAEWVLLTGLEPCADLDRE